MIIVDKIRDEKLQYNINIEAAKISILSSGRIDKYEYLTGEETVPSNQRQIKEQAKLSCSFLGRAFEKQTKMIQYQGEKQTKATEDNIKQLYNNLLIMSYCFQKKEKYLRIFIQKTR